MNIFTLQFISSFYFGKSHTIVLIFMKAFLHRKKAVATDKILMKTLILITKNMDLEFERLVSICNTGNWESLSDQ